MTIYYYNLDAFQTSLSLGEPDNDCFDVLSFPTTTRQIASPRAEAALRPWLFRALRVQSPQVFTWVLSLVAGDVTAVLEAKMLEEMDFAWVHRWT